MRLLAQLSKGKTVGSTIRCDKYNVDEDGGEEDAGGKDDGVSKTRREDRRAS